MSALLSSKGASEPKAAKRSSVFISCLGVGNYRELEYAPLQTEPESKSIKTRFIQLARLRTLQAKGINFEGTLEGSQIKDCYILVTKGDDGSKRKNWLDNGHGDTPCEGLKTCLHKDGIPDVKAISISNGSNESEMWEIFSQVADLIPDGADIYVDLTHGFRTLPVIVLLALEYVEKIKDARIVELTYGADRQTEDGMAPTWNLEPFLIVRKWADAVDSFVRYGDTRHLADCAKEPTREVKKFLRQDMPKELFLLHQALHDFGEAIQKCYSPGILSAAAKLLSYLETAQQESRHHPRLQPLALLLARVAEKLAQFPKDTNESFADLKAQWAAASWCFEHDLAIQGLTFLREGFVESLELGVRERTDVSEPADSLFGYITRYASRQALREDAQPQVDALVGHPPFEEGAWQDFLSVLPSLTDLRNKLDHAYRGHPDAAPVSAEQLRSRANKFLDVFQSVINSLASQR